MSFESRRATSRRLRARKSNCASQHFNEADAWALGSRMRAAAEARKLPFVIDIRIGNRPLFYTALAGFHARTIRNGCGARSTPSCASTSRPTGWGASTNCRARAFDASRGIDPMDYAPAGGGFPIHIIGTGVVGAITVSGVPQREDHGFVVEMICAHLGVDPAPLALGPEDA